MSKPTGVLPLTRRRPKIFYGWWITVASSVQALYTSGSFFFGFSAFFNPIANEFGWSKAATAAALSFQRTESGIVGPFVGTLVDRYGPRGMMLGGTIITAAGFFFMARIHSLLTFYLAFGVTALGISMASFITTSTVVGNWFSKYRARAMTVATAGGALGGVMAPALVWAIANYGWRSVLDWIGIGTLLVGIPASLVMRRRPEDYGYFPDGLEPDPPAAAQAGNASKESAGPGGESQSPRVSPADSGLTVHQMVRTPAFWQLILGMGLSGMAMSTVVVFSIPGLESFGISSAAAGVTLMFLSIITLLARFPLGFMADVVDKRWVLAATYLMIGLGTLAFSAVHQWWQVVFFLALYPAGHGGTIPVRLALLGDYFGRKSFGSLMGLTMTLTAVFGIVGPIFTGWVFDVTGSYRWALIIIGLLVLPGIPLTLMAKPPAATAQARTRQ